MKKLGIFIVYVIVASALYFMMDFDLSDNEVGTKDTTESSMYLAGIYNDPLPDDLPEGLLPEITFRSREVSAGRSGINIEYDIELGEGETQKIFLDHLIPQGWIQDEKYESSYDKDTEHIHFFTYYSDYSESTTVHFSYSSDFLDDKFQQELKARIDAYGDTDNEAVALWNKVRGHYASLDSYEATIKMDHDYQSRMEEDDDFRQPGNALLSFDRASHRLRYEMVKLNVNEFERRVLSITPEKAQSTNKGVPSFEGVKKINQGKPGLARLYRILKNAHVDSLELAILGDLLMPNEICDYRLNQMEHRKKRYREIIEEGDDESEITEENIQKLDERMKALREECKDFDINTVEHYESFHFLEDASIDEVSCKVVTGMTEEGETVTFWIDGETLLIKRIHAHHRINSNLSSIDIVDMEQLVNPTIPDGDFALLQPDAVPVPKLPLKQRLIASIFNWF